MFSASTTSAVSSARGSVCLPRTLPWQASLSSASWFRQAMPPPARLNLGSFEWTPPDPSEKKMSAATSYCPGIQEWFRFFPQLSMFWGPDLASKSNHFLLLLSFLAPFVRCTENSARWVAGIANLCVTLSPQPRNLVPSILGKDRQIVHLQERSSAALKPAAGRKPPQFS